VADTVFINGRSAVHAGSSGQSMCFPDVNLCPPTPPAGPIPTPLPNIAMAADLAAGATSVSIGGNPVAKKSSFFAKSTGNEVAQPTGGGVVSHMVQGLAYFTSYSMDVTIEGEEAPRHLDMMTHNHAAQTPPNSAMGTYLAMMDPAIIPPAKDAPAKRPEDKPQSIDFYLDHAKNQPTGAAESVTLVSDDGKYSQTLPVSAASPKGGLLCLTFPNVLPRKGYSLYWKIGDDKLPIFEHVAFVDILAHAPGTERPKAPDKQPTGDPNDPEQARLTADPPPADHPDDWYEEHPWGQDR
jgi:hypothetical protein